MLIARPDDLVLFRAKGLATAGIVQDVLPYGWTIWTVAGPGSDLFGVWEPARTRLDFIDRRVWGHPTVATEVTGAAARPDEAAGLTLDGRFMPASVVATWRRAIYGWRLEIGAGGGPRRRIERVDHGDAALLAFAVELEGRRSGALALQRLMDRLDGLERDVDELQSEMCDHTDRLDALERDGGGAA